MLLLVSGASSTVREYQGNPHLGLLAVPRAGNTADHYRGWTWAADNGAFTGFDETRYLRMLDRLIDVPGCRFVACPDVVADAASTLGLLEEWAPRLRADGWPVALVAQDGLTVDDTPWEEIDALFIGGSTGWKLGPSARDLVAAARSHGKWAHVGRVNTPGRIRYCASIGADSIDGTQWSMFARTYLADGLASIANLARYPQLDLQGATA
jgi:hypothetical protein